MTTEKGWKPVKRGALYCSPRCGGGCTYAAYRAAEREAAALAKRMGPGWVPRVWENMGWHWQIVKGDCSISSGPNYWCNFNPNDLPQIHAHGRTPKAALDAVRKIMMAVQKRWQAVTL